MVKNKGKLEMMDLFNGVLGGLVGITAGCYLYTATSAYVVGIIGALLVLFIGPFIDKAIDDPVGATTVHGIGGIWGVVAVGLFAEAVPLGTTNGRAGLLLGGGWYFFGIQSLAALALTLWGISSSFILLFIIDKINPLRMDEHEELIGADIAEHNLEPIKCCPCDLKESRVEKSHNLPTTVFDKIANERERNFQKQGKDNFGYQGRFTLRTIEPRVVTVTKQDHNAQETL